MKTGITGYRRRIEQMQARHMREAEALAKEVRDAVIVPLCRARGLRLAAGMGTYTLYDPGADIDNHDLEGVKKMLDLLDIVVIGGYQHALGELMGDIK